MELECRGTGGGGGGGGGKTSLRVLLDRCMGGGGGGGRGKDASLISEETEGCVVRLAAFTRTVFPVSSRRTMYRDASGSKPTTPPLSPFRSGRAARPVRVVRGGDAIEARLAEFMRLCRCVGGLGQRPTGSVTPTSILILCLLCPLWWSNANRESACANARRAFGRICPDRARAHHRRRPTWPAAAVLHHPDALDPS